MKLIIKILYIIAFAMFFTGIVLIQEKFGLAIFITGGAYILGYEIALFGERW